MSRPDRKTEALIQAPESPGAPRSPMAPPLSPAVAPGGSGPTAGSPLGSRSLLIVGAGGHARVVASVARRAGWTVAGFLDDRRPVGEEFAGARVLGPLDTSESWMGPDGADGLFLAVGDCSARRALMQRFAGASIPVLIDPSAVVAPDVSVGDGTVVMAGAVVGPGCRLEANCIVNTGAVLEAECRLAAHSHVCPGTVLGAGAEVGEASMVGTGALLLAGVRVGAGCLVGAGALVRRRLADGSRFVGRTDVTDGGPSAP